jgi:hypothetical protein
MSRQKRRAAVTNMSGASTPAALFARGLAHLQRGQLLEAQVCCKDATATEPTHADRLYFMARSKPANWQTSSDRSCN